MKRVCGGKLYDTKAAEKIGRGSKRDTPYYTLYRTQSGVYFVAGKGNIIPLTTSSAITWAENNLPASIIAKFFDVKTA